MTAQSPQSSNPPQGPAPPSDLREKAGLAVGEFLAPLVGSVAHARQSRMFHPEGVMYRARVEPGGAQPNLRRVGQRLVGSTLVRLSSAWWKEREWPDVLGMALRFTGHDQDLLFATIRFPATTMLAPLATRYHSYLWNHFHAVSPFEVEGLGRVKLRLRSPRIVNDSTLTREQHLLTEVDAGRAVYQLQARRLGRSAPLRSWETLATLTLERPVVLHQEDLHFSPFHTGLGIRPVGFIHYLRAATYAASQRARDEEHQITARPAPDAP